MSENFRKKLESVVTKHSTDIRTRYLKGEIFQIGTLVEDVSKNVYQIVDRGSNYLTVSDDLGNVSKKWLNDVSPVKTQANTPDLIYKDYLSKNISQFPPANNAFNNLINSGNCDKYAILKALKCVDAVLGIRNSAQDNKICDTASKLLFVDQLNKAMCSLIRLNDLPNHMNYLMDAANDINKLTAEKSEETPADTIKKYDINNDLRDDHSLSFRDRMELSVFRNSLGKEFNRS